MDQTLESLREEVAILRQERDHYQKIAEEGLAPRLEALRFDGPNFSAEMTGDAVRMFALAFVSYFKSTGAENYIEMNVHDTDEAGQRYTVTVQKVGALSPHDKAARSQAQLATWVSELTALIERADEAGLSDDDVLGANGNDRPLRFAEFRNLLRQVRNGMLQA